jgi:hypothetical protein
MPGEQNVVGTAGAPDAASIEAELEGLIKQKELGEGEGKGGNATASATASISDPAEAAEIAEASRKGWVPKDKYKGDLSNWVDAKTFNERGERFVKTLQADIAALKAQLASFEGTKAAFVKFHEEALAAKDAEIKATIAAMRVQRSQAVREGDDDLAVQLEDRIDALKAQQQEAKAIPATAPAAPTTPTPSPVLTEWIADGNQWFEDEPTLRAYAIALGDDMVKNGETAKGRKFLDMISAKMAEEFPRRFAAKAAPNPHTVEGAANASSSSNSKTERDLPLEDLKLMKQFVKEGWMTKEKFLQSYWARNK